MQYKYKAPKSLIDAQMHYCSGCSHGIIHRLVAEVIDELGIEGETIGIASVGCSVFAYDYFACDMIQAAHGRAPAVATGIKRSLPNRIVFTYQGDGDLAAIGTGEIVHAAARGENFTVIFVNNAIYGMTGGQMAPTTLLGQVSKTTPKGRGKNEGNPIKVCELLSTIEGATYLERVSTHDAKHVLAAKKAIKKAFETQIKGEGFSLVEVLSACPTNLKLSPVEAMAWIKDKMIPYYPLGAVKDGRAK